MAKKFSLALRQQVGQLIIMGFDGTTVSAHLRSMLGTFQPGGIILFKRNVAEGGQVHTLLLDAQKVGETPMFRCVDLEGGTVDRLRDAVAPVPSVADVAGTGSKKLFRRHGALIGAESRALGFNVAFAPCVDLRFEASASVLGSRTVSADPKLTIRYAREFLRGLHKYGVLGSGKHFPGLGEASLDSHDQLPVIEKPWKRLWNEDLVPYRRLHKKFPFVMVAHAAYPAVTGEAIPASLSEKWMTLLRQKIGFRGLILADDLDMRGVLATASIEEAAVRTLGAGADMFLVCQKEESAWRALEAVYKRAESDPRFAELVGMKARRVLAFKQGWREVKRRIGKPPGEKRIGRLRRDIAEFTEEVQRRAREAGP